MTSFCGSGFIRDFAAAGINSIAAEASPTVFSLLNCTMWVVPSTLKPLRGDLRQAED